MRHTPRALRRSVSVGLFFCLVGSGAAIAQQAVGTVATREGSRSTGRTGAPDLSPGETGSGFHSWPTQNWGMQSRPLGVSQTAPLGQTYDASGLSANVPLTPHYAVDRQGNEIFVSPVTGISQAFGTTTQRVNGKQ